MNYFASLGHERSPILHTISCLDSSLRDIFLYDSLRRSSPHLILINK
ncbi:hypothetical protein LINPERPRIM_LOCUS2027 [Linum perenne]